MKWHISSWHFSQIGWVFSIFHMVYGSVDILLDSTRSTEILPWKKFIERVESSKIQKWHSLDSLEFSLLCFERVPSTRRVFLKEHCNFYASTENVLPYCVQHKLESESGDPSKKLNPEHLEYDYERLDWCIFTLKLKYINKVEILLKFLDIVV